MKRAAVLGLATVSLAAGALADEPFDNARGFYVAMRGYGSIADQNNILFEDTGEVAGAVSEINGTNRDKLYESLLRVAQRKTKEADTKLDAKGKKVEDENGLYGDNVLIVEPEPLIAPENLKNGKKQAELFSD